MSKKIIADIHSHLTQIATDHPELQQDEHWTAVVEAVSHLSNTRSLQEQLLETSAEISNIAGLTSKLDDLLTQTIVLIQDRFSTCYVGIFLLDESKQQIRLRADSDSAETNVIPGEKRLKIEAETPIGRVISQSQIHHLSSPRLQPDDLGFQSAADTAVRSETIIPLIGQGPVLGVLLLQRDTVETYSEHDLRSFEVLGSQLAHCIQNVLLFTDADFQLEQLAALHNINLQIGSQLDIDTLVSNLARLSAKLLDADASVVRLIDDSQKSLQIRARYDQLQDRDKLQQIQDLGITLGAQILKTEQPFLTTGLPNDLAPEPEGSQLEAENQLSAALIIPLLIHDKMIGSIEVYSFSKHNAFDDNDMYILSLLASQAATAIENTRLFNEAENARHFLKSIIEHIPDPIFIKDRNHTWIEMNQANASVIGQPAEKLIGKTDRLFFSPELADEFYRRDDEVFETNEIFEHEDITTWSDGQQHTAYTRLIPITDPQGNPEFILGITHDITQRKALEVERERFFAETAALYGGSQAIANAFSERQVFEALFEQIRTEKPHEISAFLFNTVKDEPVWAVVKANWHGQDDFTYPLETRFYLPETKHARLLTIKQALFIEDVGSDPRLSEEELAGLAPYRAQSMALLPLSATGQEIGLVAVHFSEPHKFTKVTRRFWLALIDQAGVALSNRQLIQEAAYRAVQMETAAEVARAASLLDLNELLSAAVALIGDRFHLYYTGIFLVDDSEAWAELRAGTGKAGQIQLENKHRLKVGGESMIGWCIENLKPRIALDIGQDAVHFANPDLPDTRSEMALPLIHRNKAIGALTVQSAEQAAFSREDVIFLQTMADQLANAIENARLFEQAQQEILDRKRAEEELSSSELKYRELVENANSIIIRINTEGFITFFNEYAQEFFGFPEEDIVGQPVVGTIVPVTDTAGQNLTAMMSGILDRPQDYASNENENIRRDGERVWITWANKAILDETGSFSEVLCIGNDATERKQAQEALATRERYLAAQLEMQSKLLAYKGHTPPYGYILGLLGQASGASRVYAYENKHSAEDKILAYQKAEWRAEEIQSQRETTDLNIVDLSTLFPRWAKTLSQGKPISGAVSEFPTVERTQLTLRDVLAIMILPLTVSGEFFGFVIFEKCLDGRPWDASEIDLMNSAAVAVSLWYERQRAEEGLLKALEKTESYYRIGDAMTTVIDEKTTFETILSEYLRLLNLRWGVLTLLNRAKSHIEAKALVVDGIATEPDLKLPVDSPVYQHLVEHPGPLVIGDVETHPLTKNNRLVRKTLKAKSMLYLPVHLRGQPIGIMAAGSAEKDHNFSPTDLETGEVIADQLAIWLENRQLLEEAQYRSDRLQTAAEISSASSSILDPDELISTAVNLIRDRFDFYYVGLFLVDDENSWAVLKAGTGEAGRIQLEKEHRLEIGEESMVGWSVKHRQARITQDVGQEAVRFVNPILPNTRSEMALPLIAREGVIGALTVQSVERRAFSDEDVVVLQTVANQLANAIANASLFDSVAQAQAEAEIRLQETMALQRLSQLLSATLQVDEILDIFFQTCTKEIKFEYVQLSLVDKARNRVRAVAGVGVTESNIRRANRSLDSQDIMADTVRTGETEIITGWDHRFDKETFEKEGHAEWVRIFTPISLRNENIGLVEAGFNKSAQETIQESQIRLLKAFITQTALALDNAKRYEASQRRAHREALIKDISTKVLASTDLDTILRTTVKEVGDAIGGKRAYIHLVTQPEANGDKDSALSRSKIGVMDHDEN